MAFYEKLPVIVEAFQWTGDENQVEDPAWMNRALREGWCWITKDPFGLIIKTLEGDFVANPGDYIIKGVNGEFYPCKEDIFNKTYKEIEPKPV